MTGAFEEQKPSVIPAAEGALLAGAERRIARALMILGVAGTVAGWLVRDWRWAAGFAIGAVLATLNFRWMKGGVQAIVDAAAPAPVPPGATAPRPRRGFAGVLLRFVLRYALIGAAGYAILKSSFVSLGAFFLGLFLIIAAILTEIAYEVFCAFRKA